MKATKVIAAGLLIAAVLFLCVYALFPEETGEPVVSHITLSPSANSKDGQALEENSSEDKPDSSISSKPAKGPPSSSSKSSSSSESSEPEIALPLNINTATAEELCQIDGITEELARLIVLYREKAGGYTSTEDLKKITQFGYNTYNKIKDSIYCE